VYRLVFLTGSVKRSRVKIGGFEYVLKDSSLAYEQRGSDDNGRSPERKFGDSNRIESVEWFEWFLQCKRGVATT